MRSRHGLVSWRLGIVLAAALTPDLASGSGNPLPETAAAQRQLERARSALERIVGRELLRAEVPPLPEISQPYLSVEEATATARLDAAQTPEEWSDDDRRLLAQALDRNSETLEALDEEDGSAFAMEFLLPLVQASRLLSLRSRDRLSRGDEAGFLEDTEIRCRLIDRLRLQPQLVASTVAVSLEREVLRDVQLVVERPGSPRFLLAALQQRLEAWGHLPDAAATVSREALLSLDAYPRQLSNRPREMDRSEIDPRGAVVAGPMAGDYALFATRCRQVGCRAAAREVTELAGSDANPYSVFSEILLPNIWNALRKLEETEVLAALALTAISLRLEAEERGAYPPELEPPVTGFAAGRGPLDGLTYRREGSTARLELDPEPPMEPTAARPGVLPGLLAWSLPPVTGR